eukprot:gene6745-9240_t
MSQYWNFINRSLSQSSTTPRGIDKVPDIVVDTIMCTAFFSFIHILCIISMRTFAKKWAENIGERKRREWPAYVACTMHHIIMVPYAWLHIYQDLKRSNEVALLFHYAPVEVKIAPFCLGYLFGDTLCYAIPYIIEDHGQYVVHHALTIWLIISSFFAPGSITRFIPHLLICDTGNLFFNIAWLLRLSGLKETLFVTFCEIIFAVSFFFIRGINLPLVFLSLYLSPLSEGLGFAKYAMLPIALLQWFWLSKIIPGIYIRIFPSKKSIKYG